MGELETGKGLTVGTSFSLYAYAIDYALNSGKGGNSPINIDLTGATTGSFVIAYNCATSGSSCSGGNIGATPFTNAGDTTGTVAPEPGSMALLGTGLLALGTFARRKLLARASE